MGIRQQTVLCYEDWACRPRPVNLVDAVTVGQSNLKGIIQVVGVDTEASKSICLIPTSYDNLLMDCNVHSVETLPVVQHIDVTQVHLHVHN